MAASPVAPNAAEARHAIALRANAIRMKRTQRKGSSKTGNGLFLPSPNLMASALTHFSDSSSKSKSKSATTSTNLHYSKHNETPGSLSAPTLQKTLSAPPRGEIKSEVCGVPSSCGLSQPSLPFLASQPTGVAMALATLQQQTAAAKSFPNLASLFGSNQPYVANRASDSLGSVFAQMQCQRADQTSQLVAALLQANKSAPAGNDMLETVAQLLLQRYAAQKQQQQQQSLLQQLLNPTFQKPPIQSSLWQPEVQIPDHDASLSGPSDSSESDGGCLFRNSSSGDSGDDAPLGSPPTHKQRLESSGGVSTSGFESCSIQTDGWASDLWPDNDDLSALLGPVGRNSLPEGNLDPMTWREPQPDDGSPRNWVPTTPPNVVQPKVQNDSSSIASPGTCSFSPAMSSSVAPTPVKNNPASMESFINALAAGAPGLTSGPLSYPGLANLASQDFGPGSFMEAVASAATLSAPSMQKAPHEALAGLVESLTQQQTCTAVPPVGSYVSSLPTSPKDQKAPVRPALSAFSAKPPLSSTPPKPKPPPSPFSSVESKAAEAKSGEQKRGPFSEEEDRRFLGKLAEYGRKITFKKMTQFFPGRTERQLRRRWVRLKRKHNIITISGVQEVLDRLPPIPKEAGPITLEQLVECFKLPMQDACQKLSAGRPQVLTTQRFRQLFQKYGISRWPYRQVMAGRPIPEILKAAEEERARRKHLETVCLASKSAHPTGATPWTLPAVSAEEEGEEEETWAHESDDDSSDDDDEDSELLDAELDGLQSEVHSVHHTPLRTHSFGGFPTQLQTPPLSRCTSAMVNAKRTAGIAVPSLHNFLTASPVKPLAFVKEEKGSCRGRATFLQKATPHSSEQGLFSDMAAEMLLHENGIESANKKSSGGDPEWQSYMLVDDSDNPDGGKGPMKRCVSDPIMAQEEAAHKRSKSC